MTALIPVLRSDAGSRVLANNAVPESSFYDSGLPPVGRKGFVFNRWRRRTEQLFSFAEYLLIKLVLFCLAVIGALALVREHLR